MSRTSKCEGVLSKLQAKIHFLFQALQTINWKYQILLLFRLIMVIRYVNIIPSEDMLDWIIRVLPRNVT